MQIKNTYWLKLLKEFTTLSILCFLAGADIQAQNPVEGYSVLQQVVSKAGGVAKAVEEGGDDSYFIEYLSFYGDTLSINSHDNQIIFNDALDTMPLLYTKIIKYNKDHQPVAEQIVYSFQSLADYKMEEMKYDGGDLFIEFDILIRTDIQREFYVGGQKIQYGPTDFYSPLEGQVIVVLDGETMEYKSHIVVQSDGEVGRESWNVKDGFLYFRRTPVNLMVVAQDSFSIEHEGFDRKWINVVKYDYTANEVVWNKVVATKLPVSGILFFPIYLGLDIDNNRQIFVSLGDMGPPYILANDTIFVGEADIGHGAVIVLNTDGEIVRSDIVNGNALVVDVKTIDDHSFLLAQAYSDFIDYRGVEMGSENEDLTFENFVIKVDRDGNYLDHYNTFSGCGKLYNYMRLNSENNLQLFGEYSNYDDYCDNTTNEGQELPDEHSGSILILDEDVNVISNALFSAESLQTSIPHDKHISSSGKLVNYITNDFDVQWPYFDEEPFFFEGAEENFRSIVLARSDIVDNVVDIGVDSKITLYPNPSDGFFEVKDEAGILNYKEIGVYNSTGIQIKTLKKYNHEAIDLSNEPSGTYIIKLITDTEIITKKLIKI